MISKLHDSNGKIIAYVEYWQVCKSGFHKPYGEYLWVHDAWIHEDERGNGLLRQMIEQVLFEHPEIQYGYWRREKYNDRQSKIMTRERFMKYCLVEV